MDEYYKHRIFSPPIMFKEKNWDEYLNTINPISDAIKKGGKPILRRVGKVIMYYGIKFEG